MISEVNRIVFKLYELSKANRKLVASAALASLVFLGGCSCTHTLKNGQPYCVKRLNLGLVQFEMQHRDKHHCQSNGWQTNANQDCQCGDWENATGNQEASEQSPRQQGELVFSNESHDELQETFKTMPEISKDAFGSVTDDSLESEWEPNKPAETTRRTHDNHGASYNSGNSSGNEQHLSKVTLPSMNIPFSQIIEPKTEIVNPKNNQETNKEKHRPLDEYVVEDAAGESPLQSIAGTFRLPMEDSPLKLIAEGYPSQPFQRLASLGKPEVFPGPHDELPTHWLEQSPGEHLLVEPMIRLRAIPVQRKIPDMPSLAQFRELPIEANVPQLVMPGVDQTHEATDRVRDNWR